MARRREAGSVADGSDSARSWKRFAAATGASLVGVTAVDAAITHVVPPTPIRVAVSNGNPVGIDLDNDSIFDVQLRAAAFTSAYGGTFLGSLQGLGGAVVKAGSFFGSSTFFYGVQRYGAGAAVVTSFGGSGSFLRLSTTYFDGAGQLQGGQWGLNDTAYAGFLDNYSGIPRVGWIKVRTESSGGHLGAVEVLEWAFQAASDGAIMAGQTMSGDPIPGDYDGNGSVGPEDYTEWKSAFNSSVTPGTGADGNSDGTVNAADYTVWRDNLNGSGSGALAANVPEPTTVSLGVLALGAAGIAALRRRAS
jgi:hypothetical protein